MAMAATVTATTMATTMTMTMAATAAEDNAGGARWFRRSRRR